jgi:O-antigen ligase
MKMVAVRRYALYTLSALLLLYFCNAMVPMVSPKGVLYWMVLAFLVVVVGDRHRFAQLAIEPAARPFIYLPLVLFALSLLPLASMQPGAKSQQMLLFSVVMLLVALMVLAELPARELHRLRAGVCAALVVGSAVQLYGQLQHDARMSYFSNPHYAAQFSMLAMLLLAYFVGCYRAAWQRALLLLALLACGWLLIATLSRPAWMALALTAAGAIALFCRPRWWVAAFAGLGLLLTALYWLLPAHFSDRIDDLVGNFGNEERLQIWSDGARMQLASDPLHWVVGHGPGSYAQTFKAYYTAEEYFLFPHNFLLELLFESGLLGLVLVVWFYVQLYRLIVGLRRQSGWRAEALLLYGCITANLLFAFLTVPFYSRYLLLTQVPFVALAIHWWRTLPAADPNHRPGSSVASAPSSAVSMAETEKAVS